MNYCNVPKLFLLKYMHGLGFMKMLCVVFKLTNDKV